MNRREARSRLLDGSGVEEGTVAAAGIATSVLRVGDGPPLLLLHGMTPAGGVVWWPVLAPLAEDYGVVAPDLPGFGESGLTADRYDRSMVSGWLAGLLSTLGLEKVHLVATSLGGALALDFALRHPDRIDSLALVNAAGLGRFRPPAAFLFASTLMSVRPSERSFDRAARHVIHSAPSLVERHGERWLTFRAYAIAVGRMPDTRRAQRRIRRPGNVRPLPIAELATLSVPIALVWGEHDRVFPVDHARAAHAHLPRSSLSVIPRAAHLPYLEQPEVFVERIKAHVSPAL